MHKYIAKRLVLLIPAWLLASIMIFGLMRLVPGDAALLKAFGGEEALGNPEMVDQLRAKLGLDRPLPIQYLDWMLGIVRGDMGRSFWSKKPVLEEIWERLPVTLELAIGSTVVAVLIAVPTGVIAATRQDTLLDYVARLLGIGGMSIPNFWLGTLFIVFPAILLGYLPPFGYVSPLQDPWANLRQFIFPWITLGTAFAASIMRMTRSQMLEVLRQDYIRTAWAKGLRERAVIYGHAIKNALIPVLTIVGIDFGYLLGRTIVVEQVFVLPGLGNSTLRAIIMRDYPQVQANILFIATMFVVVNLVVDVLYGWVDPRIRYQ